MTKSELEQIAGIKAEIKAIQAEIQDLPIATDKVRGSMPVHPYIEQEIRIQGVDICKAVSLEHKLRHKLDELQDMVMQMEDWLDSVADAEMRSILRLKYRNGMKDHEIGYDLGYERSTISRKVQKFLNGLE